MPPLVSNCLRLIFQKEIFSSPNTSNKLYTQLTISSKPHFGGNQKDSKLPALKKRRSSTSDKPSDVNIGDNHKKSKVLETCDIYNKNNFTQQTTKFDNSVFLSENNIDKKNDGKSEPAVITTNGKSSAPVQQVLCF